VPSNNNRHYIGIDGGGTKTVCIIGDEHGRILHVYHGEGTNVKSKSWSVAQRIIVRLIEEALRVSGSDREQLAAIFLGLSGSDRPADKQRWREYLASLLPRHVHVVVHHDAINALAAGTWGQGGVVLIAGTGSIAYGFDLKSGKEIRVGGWGYLLGDEGSGFDLGRRGLMAVMRAYDGRGASTLMTFFIMEELGLSSPAELISYYYESGNVRAAIADTTRFVLLAAEQGDPVALDILDEMLAMLRELVITAIDRLGTRENIPLVLSGGLFGSALFAKRFLDHPELMSVNCSPERLLLPPAIGSYVLALAEAGCHITEQMKQRIQKHFKEQEELYDGADQYQPPADREKE